MPEMIDPYNALVSFAEAFENGELDVAPGRLDGELVVHTDRQKRNLRLTYARRQARRIVALVVLVPGPPLEGRPCFGIGYATVPELRRRGIAKELVRAAIAEMRNGFAPTGMLPFWIEAIIGVDNEASQRVAEVTISSHGEHVTDEISGLPALQYLLRVE